MEIESRRYEPSRATETKEYLKNAQDLLGNRKLGFQILDLQNYLSSPQPRILVTPEKRVTPDRFVDTSHLIFNCLTAYRKQMVRLTEYMRSKKEKSEIYFFGLGRKLLFTVKHTKGIYEFQLADTPNENTKNGTVCLFEAYYQYLSQHLPTNPTEQNQPRLF